MTVASTRVTLLFSLLDGAEEASTSFATAPQPSPGQQEMEELAGIASAAFLADFWNSTAGGHFPTSTDFLGASVATYNGQNELITSGSSLLVTPFPGNGPTLSLPPGTAEVVSLRTAQAGARGRGRMYLPALGNTSINVAGRIDSTVQQDLLAGMVAFFDSWNADLQTFPVGVASQAGSFVSTVTSVRVGNVFDSQRRRRDQLTESYLSSTLA